MGEYIAQQMYPGVKREDLTEEQRQTISALGTLAAGLAGGVTGDSTAGAVAGAQAGRNAIENNALSGLDGFGTGFWNNIQAQGSSNGQGVRFNPDGSFNTLLDLPVER